MCEVWDLSYLQDNIRSRIWHTTPVRISIYFTAAWILGLIALNIVVFASAKNYLLLQGDEILQVQSQELAALPVQEIVKQIHLRERTDLRKVRNYGLFTKNGERLAGNIARLPSELPLNGQAKWVSDQESFFGSRAIGLKLVGGEGLVVGYNAKSLTNLKKILTQTLLWSCLATVIIGAGLGIFLGLGPIRRVKRVQEISRKIADGELFLRLPLSSKGDELDMLSGLVNSMISEIESLLSDVKSVGDNVAHDLRTPLNQLRGHLHRAIEQWDADENEQQRLRVMGALEATNTLLERFRALQRISEIDNRSRRAGMALIDLTELFEEMAESYAAVAQEAGIGFDCRIESGSSILADKHVIAEVLSNLLENALKFTPIGGEVGLSLNRPDGKVVIKVWDSGPGIPAEDRERVLLRFGRSPRDQGVPGAGLGLAIVNAGARLHDFHLTLADANPGLIVTLNSKTSHSMS